MLENVCCGVNGTIFGSNILCSGNASGATGRLASYHWALFDDVLPVSVKMKMYSVQVNTLTDTKSVRQLSLLHTSA